MTSYADIRSHTVAALNEGDYESAFRALQQAIDFRSHNLDGSESQFVEAFQLFAQISQHFADGEFVGLIRDVSENPNDIQKLYDLGYALYEANLPAIGATTLARADELAPGTPAIVSELVTSLEACNACESAVAVLQKYPELTTTEFLPAYQLAFNSAMSGDLDTLRNSLQTVSQLSSGDENDDYMTQRIQNWVHRADQLSFVSPLDRNDLRGWHYLTTGGILTHLSPFGFPEPMNGRFAMLGDSFNRIRTGIDDLQRIVAHYSVPVESITPLEDRGSQILGTAVATAMDLPLRQWSVEGQNARTIVVAYDLSAFDDLTPYKNLRKKEPGQLLFSHAMRWVQSCPFAPDIVTLLHQYNTAPWESQLRLDPDTNDATHSEPDDRSPKQIASDILNATDDLSEDSDAEVPELSEQFLNTIQPFPTATATRENFWESSPVKSASFL